MEEVYKPVLLQKLTEYVLYPSSIAFYGYGAVSSIGRFKKSHMYSSDPSIQAFRAHADELRRMNPSIPRAIFKPGEFDELRGENIGIRVTIHKDPTHKWHIDHTMFVPGVSGSTFCHERYDEFGDVKSIQELRLRMFGREITTLAEDIAIMEVWDKIQKKKLEKK